MTLWSNDRSVDDYQTQGIHCWFLWSKNMLLGLLCMCVHMVSWFRVWKLSKPHLADGLPQPLRITTKLGVHFSESFHPYKDQMSIKKNFHQPVLKLQAKQCSRYSPNGPYRPCCLACNSETGWWKSFLMLIWSLYGWKLSEKWTPNFVAIRKG